MSNNLHKGKLKRWNDDKGFGFISSENRRRDIFIHISALKRMSRRPIVGDVITFQVHTDSDGKQRAVNAKIEGVTEVNLRTKQKYVGRKNENNWVSKALFVALGVGIGFVVYVKYVKDNYSNKKALPQIEWVD